MSQPFLSVLDAGGTARTIFTANPNGQANAANSQPVVLASDQALPLPVGAATDASITNAAGVNHADLVAVQNKLAVLPTGAAETDRSGSIAAGGTAQVAMAANAARKYFEMQNLDGSNVLYFRKDGVLQRTVDRRGQRDQRDDWSQVHRSGGLIMGSMTSAPSGNKFTPPVSQYDRALIFAPPVRQVNAVKGFSRNINDAQYVGAITDQDLYDCEAGALTVGMSYSGGTPTNTTSKALQFPWGKMLWDLGAGESLLIQMRVKTVASVATANLCGNYNATDGGFSIGLYDATNATTPGYPYFNYKAQGAAAQSINIPAALVGASTVTMPPLPTDAYFNLTVHVDGASRMLTAYINGAPHINAGVSQLNAGSSMQTVNHNFGLGHVPADDTYTTSLAKAVRFQAFRMAVLPAGLQFANVGLLDWHFNNNPRALFSDAAYLGGV
jgi:hypothetical protein